MQNRIVTLERSNTLPFDRFLASLSDPPDDLSDLSPPHINKTKNNTNEEIKPQLFYSFPIPESPLAYGRRNRRHNQENNTTTNVQTATQQYIQNSRSSGHNPPTQSASTIQLEHQYEEDPLWITELFEPSPTTGLLAHDMAALPCGPPPHGTSLCPVCLGVAAGSRGRLLHCGHWFHSVRTAHIPHTRTAFRSGCAVAARALCAGPGYHVCHVAPRHTLCSASRMAEARPGSLPTGGVPPTSFP